VYNPLANALHRRGICGRRAVSRCDRKPFVRIRGGGEVPQRPTAAGSRDGGVSLLFHPVTRRALDLAGDGTLVSWSCRGAMAMPCARTANARWSLELAGGA